MGDIHDIGERQAHKICWELSDLIVFEIEHSELRHCHGEMQGIDLIIGHVQFAKCTDGIEGTLLNVADVIATGHEVFS